MAAKWLFPGDVQSKVLILKNGIDTQRFRFRMESRLKCREELNIREEFVIGHIGRFAEQKNHMFLLDVFKHIYLKDNKVRLLLIGSGSLKSTVITKIDEMGISSVVIIIDETSCPEYYYCAMDVFVFPSLFEGLGISAVEAQCSGLPCVISENCPEEVVLTNNCRRISLKEDLDVWCERILAYKGMNIESRGDCYQKIVDCGYDISQSVCQLCELYRKEYCPAI